MIDFNSTELAWKKMNGLIPAIVQDAESGAVLMLGYMNEEALAVTLESGWVTFFSRSKNRLWTKGETSNHKLKCVDIINDCDQDTLLVLAKPMGPACHQGTATCFGDETLTDWTFVINLENLIKTRKELRPEGSYVSSLFNAGKSRIAQKVGEEGVEVALAAIEKNDEELCGEVADLWFHTLVLLQERGLGIGEVIRVLKGRRV